jgi:hypothetical protein
VERGEVSWVTLLLVTVVSISGYLGSVWGPIWFEQMVVKQTVRDFMNQAIKNPHDGELRRMLSTKLQGIATIEVVDQAGERVQRPAVAVEERDITWERSAGDPPILRVAFEYDRPVKYPLIDRTEVKLFQVDMTTELKQANWDSGR